jgi:gliding motility-associated-like protein
MITRAADATHIVGGEITYRYLENYDYEITLKLYRDCHNGLAKYDNPTTISIFNAAGNAILLLDIPFPGAIELPLVSINPCLHPPHDVCVEEAVFVKTVNLPPIPGGYQLSYERCCRNDSIQNIINPLATGSTYYTIIPDTVIVKENSSPVYNNFPPIYICQNEDFDFDHSATDADGDSLSYELCTPYLGANQSNPYPRPASSPPYSFVTYSTGYNATDPLGHDAITGYPLTIDAQTGHLTGKPNTLGKFVVGVCVSEYRDGILLSVNKRDFQFNVTECPPISTASLPSNIIECGYTISFQNFSINAFNYFWDFGDPTTLSDTSLEYTPSYTYPDTGSYTVTLIVNKGLICADTAFSQVYIYHSITGANFSAPDKCIGDSTQFTDQSILSEGPAVAWHYDFGDGQTSSLQNPVHTYTLAKDYQVTFVAYNKNGCTDTLRKNISVYPLPVPDAGDDTIICANVQFQLQASGGGSYQWQNSPDLSCTACSNPVVSPTQTAYYSVTVTDSKGCEANDSIQVTVRPVIHPVISFTYTGRCYSDPVPFNAQINNFDFLCWKSIKWQWDFGDGTSSTEQNPSHLFNGTGPFEVSLKIPEDTATFKRTITLLEPDSCLKNMYVPNTFTPNGDNTNDLLFLRAINAKKIVFRIYNRWGEEVFKTYNIQEGWDGTYQGEKLTPQVLVFIAEVTFYDDTEVVKKGNITLME